ncbi:hypothetical protein H2198_010767 [Neophaeococcomyces mojaviensis]|uniref:Uncharacterized protein n=1 Tax=Neophaeococcomyces mojaviensis TaxID=3383035 RepID=A0ACC2ZQV3_9EURO|nr:hypothetical protein H2198_010767 [Knufia sp. JES_112]
MPATSVNCSPLQKADKSSHQEIHPATGDQANHLLGTDNALSGLRPRKYQIDKSSLNVRKRAWQQEENDLDQILDEERQAWSRRSQKDLRAQYSSLVTLQPTAHEYLSYGSTITDTLDEISAQRPQKSSFVEGSMNERSKAIASTWQPHSSGIAQTFEASDHSICSDNDSDATPRPSIERRTSTSSSFDINDFKPLPPTPSTLTTTIKRLGQKFKPGEAKANPPTKAVDLKAQRSPKKGLRKSMSTWKIFSTSISDLDSDETANANNVSVRTNNTIKSRDKMRTKIVPISDDVQRSVLDDRKRKAEIAYAEQFGVIKKKQKDNSGLVNIPSEHDTPSPEPVTVRKRAASGIAPVRAMKSVLPKVEDNSETEVTAALWGGLTGTDSASSSMPPISCRTRSKSRDSSLSFDSDTDRRRRHNRRSYSELEKENQHLRLKLRESESQLQIQLQHSPDQPVTVLDSTPLPEPRNTSVNSLSSLDPNWKLREDQPPIPPRSASRQNADQSRNRRSRSPPRSEPCPTQPTILVRPEEGIPPVPSVPLHLSSRTILAPTTVNGGHTRDTATIKRRAPISNNSNVKLGAICELPRPLSMVLEGVEDGEDGGTGESIGSGSKTVSLNKTINGRFDGASEEKREEVADKWEWPEDVF